LYGTVERRWILLFEIDAKDDRPAYLQIVDQVKYAAASGRLRPGEALPSIRQLAERLRVNRNTVDKAYRELDRQGLITTAQGRGAFLSESALPDDSQWCQELLSETIDGLVLKARQLRVTRDELIRLIDERYGALGEESKLKNKASTTGRIVGNDE